MKLTFHGAAGEVTGSCFELAVGHSRVLVDFGMIQGGRDADRRNRRFPSLKARRLEAVVLTHAHLDHCGRLPLLAGAGFDGPIYATRATRELCDILLHDAASIQQMDAMRETRRRQRRGQAPVSPLYTEREVNETLGRFRPIKYDEPFEVAPGITVRAVDAGHIIGSSSLEFTVHDGPRTCKVCFSGDIGPRGLALLRDPQPFTKADVLIVESTYGDRDHRPLDATLIELEAIVKEAHESGGKVLIPSFAVGRTQQLVYYFGQMRREGRLPDIPVYIDSPMAVSATELYDRHRAMFDDEAWRLIRSGQSPLSFPGLRFTRSHEESMGLNRSDAPSIVIAGAGMCTGGRILHHFKHHIWKPTTHVVIVGFQAEGTLGRKLVEGAKRVSILGEPIVVNARVHTLGGLSAHAGRSGLLAWIGACAGSRPRVFLTHGEQRPREMLADGIREKYALDVALPDRNLCVEL